MTLPARRLAEIVVELAIRPGHEKVRALIYELLVYGLGARSAEIQFERALPEVHGRADALLGQTIFEFKRDLRRERRDAEEELGRYLPQRERETGERFIGIATDGAAFIPYEMDQGRLVAMTTYKTDPTQPRGLLVWLDSAVSLRPNLPPDPATICFELGRESLVYRRALLRLGRLWEVAGNQPESKLKRQLWAEFLALVYGISIDVDDLFLQHTYLTIVAKTIAVCVLAVPLPEPADLLNGRPFRDAGIAGAVESDFFDWVLDADGGEELVGRICRQVTRFHLEDVGHDVLKGLYESLVDPEQRHELGEYYTPDWLAAKVCHQAIERPWSQRVLDPACGSGTFLFHAVRRFLEDSEEIRSKPADVLRQCLERVVGIDVHPVAVIIARVAYLLAIGHERLQSRPEAISIPVYLGDSLQWNTRQLYAARDVLIRVPNGPDLLFPERLANDPARFDDTVQTMLDLSEQNAGPEAMRAWLRHSETHDETDTETLVTTYEHLNALRQSGRDHIWGYIARNLSRPLWLSSAYQRFDVIVGNPPWLSYRYMGAELQRKFREECRLRNLWYGGKLATHHDLAAYFFVRCTELYLKQQGTIAFIMPYGSLNRAQYGTFRAGRYASAEVRFTDAWAFDETTKPLFPVPSAVLFARRAPAGPLPTEIITCVGFLKRRNASLSEAEAVLRFSTRTWPAEALLTGGSPYRSCFRQGATMVPRRLCVVDRVDTGRLGNNPAAPLVVSRSGKQDKVPWRDLAPLRGAVEARFLRSLLLGESIAPFRLLRPALAVIPWDPGTDCMLDADAAEHRGYPGLSRWLREAERLWEQHGRTPMTLIQRWNYVDALSRQVPPAAIRVVYSKSGVLLSASVVEDRSALIDHKLYWAEMESQAEAFYLAGILNSEAIRGRIEALQSRGRWGARDFDKLIFALPIPRFDPESDDHRRIVALSREAARIAAGAELREETYFTNARRIVRGRLQKAGLARDLDAMVERLLS
jgi:Type I restriction-modification system methyltransferase subunit